jgi:protein-S-isoprenylcysteine O-methyltransferase Ste14
VKTDYTIGNIRIRFESRSRRRWFVVLVYAVLGLFDVEGLSVPNQQWLSQHAGSGWIVGGCMTLIGALMIVFSWLTSDMRTRGDERETHRREHAYASAYPVLGYFLIGALFAGYFSGLNPVTPLPAPSLQAFLKQLPYMLLGATGILYVTLPQTILLWTEPDMEDAQ